MTFNYVSRLYSWGTHATRPLSTSHYEVINITNGSLQILEWMDEVAQRYPEVARVEHVGKTHEGRQMRVLKVSTRQLSAPGHFPGRWSQ